MKFPEIFDQLMDAILLNRTLEIEYEKSGFQEHEFSIRSISPKRFVLVERSNSYYHRICVEAYCHLRKEMRVFAVYRIKNIKTF